MKFRGLNCSGGFDRTTSQFLTTSLIYEDQVFRPGPDLPHACKDSCTLRLNETHVFFAGGETGFVTYTAQAWIMDWRDGAWTRLPDMTHPR